MKKYFVYHEGMDSYVDADEANLTNGGDLVFTVNNKFNACFLRGKWDFFKEIEKDQKSVEKE